MAQSDTQGLKPQKGDEAKVSFVIRSGLPRDNGFIAQHWAREYRRANPRLERTEDAVFNQHIYPRIESILGKASVRIAAPPDDGVTIYGYAVYEPGLIHMVYVRDVVRRMGLAKALTVGLELSRLRWTTETESFNAWIKQRYIFAGHRPFWMLDLRRKISDCLEWKPNGRTEEARRNAACDNDSDGPQGESGAAGQRG